VNWTLVQSGLRVKAELPSDALIAFAQREGVTHLIVGQSLGSRATWVWPASWPNRGRRGRRRGDRRDSAISSRRLGNSTRRGDSISRHGSCVDC